MNQDPITIIPVEFSNSEENGNTSSSVRRQHQPRSSKGHHRKAKKSRSSDMDHDYREYFREHPPRGGEFLTRGAALASAQQQQPPPPPPSDFGGGLHHPGASVRYGGGLQQQQLEQLEMEPRRYLAAAAAAAAVRSTAASSSSSSVRHQTPSNKDQRSRNPTILRKKLDICVYLMSSMGVQMEIEDGASVTVAEILQALTNMEEADGGGGGDSAATSLLLSLPPRLTAEVFTLWMTSPLLDVQLKPHHKPFYIRREWNHFLQRFSSAPLEKKTLDEPILSLQRSVFFGKRDEAKIKDSKVLELLYEEAKYNILSGRYPCEIADYIMLGGIQARLELGPFDSAVHTPAYFRTIMFRFLPEHATLSGNWSSISWIPWRSAAKNSPENRLIEQFKAKSTSVSPKRLVRNFMVNRSLPYYGSAFFHGQIETPARSLTSLLFNRDTEVLIAINPSGFYVIDPANVVVLLALKLEELSWDYAKPSQENNEDCLPCLFIQFCVIENGRRVSKILQIFSKQAIQMDALIATFVEDYKQRVAMYNDDSEGNLFNDVASAESDDCLVPLTTVSRSGIPESCLSNKLNRLTLATFDDEGHCIGHMGSWSFSN